MLERHPETRDDDVVLTVKMVEIYMPEHVHVSGEGTVWLTVSAIRAIREDHVKRVRAHVQNDLHLFLPTDPSVRKKRGISEDEWKSWAYKNVIGGETTETDEQKRARLIEEELNGRKLTPPELDFLRNLKIVCR